MANLQKTLESLQPYVIGIRYLEGTVIVDAVFKEGWKIPLSDRITNMKGEDEAINYCMFYSESKQVGLDEILAHIKFVIESNQEREIKLVLLKKKVEELKVIFKNNPLSKLEKLKFTFNDDLEPNMQDLDLETTPTVPHTPTFTEPVPNIPYENSYSEQDIVIQPVQSIEGLSEEELEILEEEKRGAAYLRSKNSSKAELLQPAIHLSGMACDCDEHQACPKCIDSKGY